MLSFAHKKVFGLEMSEGSVRSVEIAGRGNALSVHGMGKSELTPGTIVGGEIKKPDLLAKAVIASRATARPHRITTPYVITSLPENHTYIHTLTIPPMNPGEVLEALRWQIEGHIPLTGDQIYLDFEELPGTPEQHDQKKYFVAACNKQVADQYLFFLKSIRLKPVAFEPEAIALTRAAIRATNKEDCFLLIDLGKTRSLFVVQDAGMVTFTMSTAIGGDMFTSTIADALHVSVEDAEKAKISCCSPDMTPQEEAVLAAIHSVLDELAREITKVLHYYASRAGSHRDVSHIMLSGGAANVSGVAPYLALKLKKKVRIAESWVNLAGNMSDDASREMQSYTKAIGLALRDAYFTHPNHRHTL